MSVSTKEIAWLAGLLEGEGCFIMHHVKWKDKVYLQPIIALASTDKDVVDHAAELFNSRTSKIRERGKHGAIDAKKTLYRATCSGATAIGWMQTVFVLMGSRRKGKIKEILAEYKAAPPTRYPNKNTDISDLVARFSA